MAKTDFTRWLAGQKDRADDVGNLANEAVRDNSWPKSASTRDAFESHLRMRGAGYKAIGALHEAWKEYVQAG